VGVLTGVVLAALDQHTAANVVWGLVTAGLLLPLTWSVIRSLLHRDLGVDAIALVAMAGALALPRRRVLLGLGGKDLEQRRRLPGDVGEAYAIDVVWIQARD
jgi:hypothetical protein